jgi:hypothetical protein
MDTDSLIRGACSLDIEMFHRLYSGADLSVIHGLRGNELAPGDLSMYADAFRTVAIYDDIATEGLRTCRRIDTCIKHRAIQFLETARR